MCAVLMPPPCLTGQVRDGLDLPFESTGNLDQVNWVVWKQQLTCLEEMGPGGPEARACSNYDATASLLSKAPGRRISTTLSRVTA